MLRFFKQLKNKIVNWCISPSTCTVGDLYQNPKSVEIYNPDTNELKFIGSANTAGVFVKTPTGWSPVKQCLKTVPYRVWTVNTPTHTLSGADTHIIIDSYGRERYIKDLAVGDVIQTISGPERITSVVETDRTEHMYDLELNDINHVYYTNGILSHNSTMSCIYLLWYAIFHFEKTILIASNKNDNAMEMIYRIKFVYERLPHWLKPGLAPDGYNKHSLGFDNGSRIHSQATSENTGRGMSISLLFCLGGETKITVRNKNTGKIQQVTLAEMYKKLLGCDVGLVINT